MRFLFVFVLVFSQIALAKNKDSKKRDPASAGIVQIPLDQQSRFSGCETNLGIVTVSITPRSDSSVALIVFKDSQGNTLDQIEACAKNCKQGGYVVTTSIDSIERMPPVEPSQCITPASMDIRYMNVIVGKSAPLQNRKKLAEILTSLEYSPISFKCTWRQSSNDCT